MAELQTGNEPIFAYFYAAWCAPCHYLKEQTYSDLRIIEAMDSFRRVKFDMSFKHSPKVAALHEKYRVRGLPHMIMMYPGSAPSTWLRVGGFVTPNVLLSAIEQFKNSAPPLSVNALGVPSRQN